MAQKIRSSKLETRSARLRLAIRKKPYFVKIARGLSLGYRRTKTAGTWVVRVTRDNSDWTQALGKADDHEEAGTDIWTFDEAQIALASLRGRETPTTTIPSRVRWIGTNPISRPEAPT